MNELEQLQQWYFSQCDGDWEHEFSITINTLDNPGWRIEIDLDGTDLEQKSFSVLEKGTGKESVMDSTDWFHCKVENQKFMGACGPFHLTTVLEIFLNWKMSS